MRNLEALIEQAGGPEVVAAGCDVTPDATRKWREAGAIPSRHWVWFARKLNISLDDIAVAATKAKRRAA